MRAFGRRTKYEISSRQEPDSTDGSEPGLYGQLLRILAQLRALCAVQHQAARGSIYREGTRRKRIWRLLQFRHFYPAAFGVGLQAEFGELHAFGTFS